MSDYRKVDFNITPYDSDVADLLAAFLADAGFDSFEHQGNVLSAYIQDSLYGDNLVESAIRDFPFDVRIQWTVSIIPHTDWNEEWEKKYFKPILLGNGKCVIHSSFHKDYPSAEYDITVDPKMAFGTGHHATTSMMADHLFKLNLKGKKVVDMGSGTGILAIIASKLGAEEIIGIEIDPGACLNAEENVRLNDADVKMILGDSSKLENIKEVDVFLANINRNIILADLDRYVNSIKKGRTLLLSGFYDSDVELIDMALKENGAKIEDVVVSADKWASIKAVKI